MTRRKALFALAAALVAGAAVWAALGLASQVRENREQGQIFERLRRTTQARAITDLGSEADAAVPQEGPEGGETARTTGHDIALLQEENPDCIGWVSIPGTNLDYPVMQTLEDPEFYLKRNFEKAYSDHGVPFLDARCGLGTADNLILYGHHMNDGTMFSSLHKYAQYSYFEEHPLITLETAGGVSQYKVAAVMRVSGIAYETQWSIFNCICLNEAEYDELLGQLSRRSLYHTGVTPAYGDKLLTLSTCEYTQKNGRLVVVAVKQ